jgi:hypothetical protein
MLPRTGILMNNGMMWFDPRPGSANQIAASARPVNNMFPVIVTAADGDWPRLAAGASGGRRILASVYQTLAFSLDFNMDVGAAAHAPRIDVSGPDAVTADMRLPDDVLEALASRAPLKVLEYGVLPINFACPNLIALDREGARACSDASSPLVCRGSSSPSLNAYQAFSSIDSKLRAYDLVKLRLNDICLRFGRSCLHTLTAHSRLEKALRRTGLRSTPASPGCWPALRGRGRCSASRACVPCCRPCTICPHKPWSHRGER